MTETVPTPSLISAFTPPRGFTGVAAVLCALSAEASVLRRILTVFTGETEEQRAFRGGITLRLALDRRSPRADLHQIPGLHVAEPYLPAWPGGGMLHAKVALLGFAVDADAPIERLRLIVSTGNWTTASLREQIDMLWIDDLDISSVDDGQTRADIKAAGGFLQDLFSPTENGDSLFQNMPSAPRIEAFLEQALDVRSAQRSRFVHSLREPLLGQIIARFERSGALWNWIYAGSGFFEQASRQDPVVLPEIVKSLAPQTTQSAERRVVVNPSRAGALASGKLPGWTFCELVPPPKDNRSFLHAKFLATGRHHNGNHLDVTVYLGSGNLSRAGLMTAFAASAGQTRIESGIVFKAGRHEDPMLWTLLPNSREIPQSKLKKDEEGEGVSENPPIPPPPILFAQIVAEKEEQDGRRTTRLRLEKAQPECPAEIRIGGQIMPIRRGVKNLTVPHFTDPYLEVRAAGETTWTAVPVIGLDGDFARKPLRLTDITEALNLLQAFPLLPDPDPDTDGESDEEPSPEFSSPASAAASRGESRRNYLARDAMAIIEQIAHLVVPARKEGDESLERLMRMIRRILLEGLGTTEKQRCAALGVNVFAALKDMPDMPKTKEWQTLVDDIARNWGMAEMPPLALNAVRAREMA